MFDKTFIKFSLGFIAIIAVGLGALYVAGYMRQASTAQTASATVK